MSTITQLICNRFGGIRHRNSQFDNELITAQDIQNIELYYTGTNGGIGIRTMKGNISVNSTLKNSEKIIDIYQSTQKGVTYFLVYTETNLIGRFYLYNTGTNTLILKKDNITKSDSGLCNGFDIAQGWSDLFFFTNGKEMFTYEYKNNVSTSDIEAFITSLRTENPNITDEEIAEALAENDYNEIVEMNNIYGRLKDNEGNPIKVMGLGASVYNNRLWIFDKNILWYSVTSNIYDFSTNGDEWITSAGYIQTIKNITAIHEYLGSLAVFYKDSSQLLTVSGGDFTLGDDSPGGCANYKSLVFHGTDLYFYDDTKKGVFAFKQVVNGDKTLSDNLAVDIQEELLNIDSFNIDKIKTLSVVLSERNEVWWIIPTSATYEHEEIVNNETVKINKSASIILIYDYLKGEWVKRKSQKINSVRVINNILYSAGDNGEILQEYSSNLFNGQYIPHYYNCSPLNLGANNTLKVLVLQPRVSFNMPYSNKFKVKYVKNFNTYKKPKIKLIKTKFKNLLVWGSSYWGIDFFGSPNTSTVGKFPNANFKILEISIYTDSADQNFSIKNIEFSKIKVKQV